MMQKVKILPLSQEQLPAAAALAQRCFPDPWSLTLFEAAFSQPDTTLFAAMATDTLAGYLILQRLGDEESVDDIAVAPEFRRQGIAQQLLETAHAQFPTCPFLTHKKTAVHCLSARQSCQIGSSVTVAAVLAYQPVLAQALGLFPAAAHTAEQPPFQRAVRIANFRHPICIPE